MMIGQAAVLGVVQGLTEFLPVSSSAHLILFSDLLHWPVPSLLFTIAVHIGTLLAVVVYFGAEWLELLLGRKPKLLWSLLVATVVTGGLALLMGPYRDLVLGARWVALVLAVFGLLLWVVDLWAPVSGREVTPSWWGSIGIGVAQALAIFPGVSRSGIIMTLARSYRMSREQAARYAFLLSAPIIALTPLELLLHWSSQGAGQVDLAVAVGFLTAVISGWLAIGWFLKLVKKVSFGWFALYRGLLALIIWIFIR